MMESRVQNVAGNCSKVTANVMTSSSEIYQYSTRAIQQNAKNLDNKQKNSHKTSMFRFEKMTNCCKVTSSSQKCNKCRKERLNVLCTYLVIVIKQLVYLSSTQNYLFLSTKCLSIQSYLWQLLISFRKIAPKGFFLFFHVNGNKIVSQTILNCSVILLVVHECPYVRNFISVLQKKPFIGPYRMKAVQDWIVRTTATLLHNGFQLVETNDVMTSNYDDNDVVSVFRNVHHFTKDIISSVCM